MFFHVRGAKKLFKLIFPKTTKEVSRVFVSVCDVCGAESFSLIFPKVIKGGKSFSRSFFFFLMFVVQKACQTNISQSHKGD